MRTDRHFFAVVLSAALAATVLPVGASAQETATAAPPPGDIGQTIGYAIRYFS